MSVEKYTFKDREAITHTYSQQSAAKTLAISNTISALCVTGKSDPKHIKDNVKRVNSIGSNIHALDDYCFYGCSNLSYANTNQVSAYGDHCFEGCSSLSAISNLTSEDGGHPTPFYSLGEYCFKGSGLKKVDLDLIGLDYTSPADYEDCRVIDKERGPFVGIGAFQDCTQLEQITFYTSTEISESEFEGCTSLKNVRFAATANHGSCVGAKCFKGCTSLQTITFPQNFQIFSDNMFEGCTALTSVSFDESSGPAQAFISIGDYCFKGCTSLTQLTIPSSIKDIYFLSENSLAESSISKVIFNGIDSKKMQQYVTQTDDSYKFEIDRNTTSDFKYGKWYGTHCKEVFNFAKAHSIPVFILETRESGCGLCVIFHNRVMKTKEFQDWMHQVPMLFVYGADGGTTINKDVMQVRWDNEAKSGAITYWHVRNKMLPGCNIVWWNKNAKNNRDTIRYVDCSTKTTSGFKEAWSKFFSDYVEDSQFRAYLQPSDLGKFTFGNSPGDIKILTSDNVKYLWQKAHNRIIKNNWT